MSEFEQLAVLMDRALAYARAHDKGDLSIISLNTWGSNPNRYVQMQIYEWDDFKLLAKELLLSAYTYKGTIHVHVDVEPNVTIMWVKPINSPFFDDNKDDILALLGESHEEE